MVVRRSAEWGQRATENAPLVRSRRNISFLALASFFVRGLLVKVSLGLPQPRSNFLLSIRFVCCSAA